MRCEKCLKEVRPHPVNPGISFQPGHYVNCTVSMVDDGEWTDALDVSVISCLCVPCHKRLVAALEVVVGAWLGAE